MASPRSTIRRRGGPGLAALLLLAVLSVWACDGLNLFSPGASAFGAPAIDFVAPSPGEGVPLNDSLLVEVEITDPDLRQASGLTRVLIEGVRFEGDPDLGTFEEFQRFEPKEVVFEEPQTGATLVRRFLVPELEGPAGIVFIRVTAEDGSGNTVVDSVDVELGAPRTRILSPEDGEEVARGSQITVRAQATDPNQVVSIEITAGGSLTLPGFPVSQAFDPPRDSVLLEQTVTLPFEVGTVEFRASAVNTDGIEGRFGPVTIDVTSQEIVDDVAPEMRVRIVHGGAPQDPRRVELTDTVQFLVEGRDNSGGVGVTQVGVTLQATSRERGGTTVVPIPTRTLSPPRTGTFTETFKVGVDELEALGVLDILESPDTVDVAVNAFMVDDRGNCAAAVSPDDFQRLTCGSLPTGETVAEGIAGQPDFVVGVTGQTVLLPEGGRIADAVVDTVRGNLVLSNTDLGQLEVFDLGGRTFITPIFVGSEPWGLTFHRTGPDTLFVANSGGTNISHVDVNQGREVLGRRILTPNTVLWQVNESEDEDGGTTFSPPEFFDFTDRPQFVAQDRNNHLVYSTRPTEAANSGTIRLGLRDLGPDTEVILYTGHSAFLQADNTHSFGNVDDVNSIGDADAASGGGSNATLDDAIEVVDHPVGDESTILVTPTTDPGTGESLSAAETIAEMFALPGAFNEGTSNGAWDLAGVGLSDTTFVAASGDGSMVAIGEGATSPFGRVIVYRAPTAPAAPEDHVGVVSSVIDVVDLFNNAAERVLGVALNEDATFGVARGIAAVSFFTPDDLRLQGTVAVDEGGAGVALHPLHSGDPVTTDPNVSLAFVPTGNRTIEVFDTRFFSRIGRVFVRQTVVGQIRATLPFAGDNAGLTCPTLTVAGRSVVRVFSDADGLVINSGTDRACTVLKLAAVTDDGGVVVVNVTVEDIVRDHPDN